MSQVITPELKTEFLGLLADVRKEYETITEQKAKGIVDPLREELMRKMDSRLDEIEAKLQKPTVSPKEEAEAKSSRSHALLNEFLRKANGATNAYSDNAPDEIKSMIASVDAQGGFLVTPDMNGRMVSKIYETSAVRQYASVQPISSDTLEGMIDNDEAEVGYVSEQGTRSDTATPEVGKWRAEAVEIYAHAKISQKLIDDANIDVAAWLEGKLANKFSRFENTKFINDSGPGRIQGFAAYPTAATSDDSRSWGTLEHLLSGANGAFSSTNPADKIIELIGLLKPGYLSNARFFTNRAVNTLMRKFKTSADSPYLWEPSLQAGAPNRLNGYEVVIFPDMPTVTTGSLSLAFGDLRQTFQIVDRLGLRLLRDPYTAKPFIVFYATKRTGSAVVNFESLKFMKFSA